MGADTNIEWAHHTFSPWWGCTRVSAACRFCYAEELANRYGHNVWGANAPRRVLGDKTWADPIRWDRQAARGSVRYRVFSGSMCDIFEDVDAPMVDSHGIIHADRTLTGERARLFELIDITPNLDWLLLTKRPENVLAKVPTSWRLDGFPPNVWVGTTVEDQDEAYKRLGWLVDIPAALRFVSCEPLLGPLNLARVEIVTPKPPHGPGVWLDALRGLFVGPDDRTGRVDWVITGGESGHHARPTDPDWFRDLRDQCAVAGVPFFFKQAGAVLARTWRMSDAKGHTLDDLPDDLRIRELPR